MTSFEVAKIEQGRSQEMRIPFLGNRKSTAVDPVCGMDVETNRPSGGSFEHEGQTYYFCGPGCNKAFQKEPKAYLSGEKKIEM